MTIWSIRRMHNTFHLLYKPQFLAVTPCHVSILNSVNQLRARCRNPSSPRPQPFSSKLPRLLGWPGRGLRQTNGLCWVCSLGLDPRSHDLGSNPDDDFIRFYTSGPDGVLQSDTRNNWPYSGYFKTTDLCVVVLNRDQRVGPYYM